MVLLVKYWLKIVAGEYWQLLMEANDSLNGLGKTSLRASSSSSSSSAQFTLCSSQPFK